MKHTTIETLANHALEDLKAIDITQLDISQHSDIADTMFVCCGRSNRHVKSIASNLITEAKQQGLRVASCAGEEYGEWIVVDLGDVIVHIMLKAIRLHYDLESLWNIRPQHAKPFDADCHED
jgi:ribosome-associated protein